MLYEELQIKLIKLLKPYWSRVISFDIETHVHDTSKFLTNERILSISYARRVSGKMMDEYGVEIKTLFLDSDNDKSEVELLKSFNEALSLIRPLCVLGYGIRQYDIPLLCIKKQHYNLLLWKLIDTCESAVHIGLYHILKYKRYKKLDDVLTSSEYSHLPLKKTSGLVPKDRKKKGTEIYRLWKENREKLRKYNQNEVYNMLLLSESIVSKGL